ncbi:hypothetical protein [Pseudoxanthomonas putridarboris]|uniref:Nuclease-related domain-containing protein n=1 Tax=Pseudoxanthomonas putridarboris TaxID=752605 RepID=A0ABU9IWS6_9GAMM
MNQHHVEMLQAIALTVSAEEIGALPPTPHVIGEAIDSVRDLAGAFSESRMARMANEMGAEESVQLALQERMRLHTQIVRNWGYSHQVREIASELYGSMDVELMAAVGFTARQLIKCIRAMVRIYEERASNRFQRLKRVMQSSKRSELVRKYFREFAPLQGTPKEFLSNIPRMSIGQLKQLLLSHADLALLNAATFDPEDVARDIQESCEAVKAIFEYLSREPGSLAQGSIMLFFMDNPVWSKPGIKHGENYLFPLPQAAFSHIHRIMRSLIEEFGLKKIYERRRAQFLERRVGEVLRRAFPTASVDPSVKWKLGREQYETDWLINLDRTLLIVEAKSAALTSEALRGSADRLKKHIGELVVAPALQSSRLTEIIKRAKSGDIESTRIAAEIKVDPNTIDTVIRLSITLDDFSMITALENDLKKVGWVPKDLELPATLSLADFETVIDILESPGVILHYFVKHPRFQRTALLVADELDLLGVYLSTLFHIPEINDIPTTFVATGESKSVDDYYACVEAGMTARKPQLAINSPIRTVLEALFTRQPSGWTTMTIDLLEVGSIRNQSVLWDGVTKLRYAIPKSYKDPKHECAMVAVPHGHEAAIAVVVLHRTLVPERTERVSQLTSEILESTGRKRVTVIVKILDQWDMPYGMAAIALAS